MRISVRWIRRLVIVFGCLLALGAVAWFWVVPAVLSRVLSSRTGSAVTLGPLWISRTAVGVDGLALHDGDSTRAPVWLRVKRVTTDLTFGGLLRGRFVPTRVEAVQPKIALRISADGRLLTSIGPKINPDAPDKGPMPMPTVWAHDAEVTLAQEGRPEFTLRHVEAKASGDLEPHAAEAVVFEAIADDAVWGKVEANGRFSLGDGSGRLRLKSLASVSVTPDALRSIPWLPPEVAQNVKPHGPVDVRCVIQFGPRAKPTVQVSSDLDLRGAQVTPEQSRELFLEIARRYPQTE